MVRDGKDNRMSQRFKDLRGKLKGIAEDTEREARVGDRFDGWIDCYPFWAWVKRQEMHYGEPRFRMLRFSRRYGMDLVGPDFSKYRGHFDHEFYSKEDAATFLKNDLFVVSELMVRQGDPTDPDRYKFEEDFTSTLDGRKWTFIGEKWAYEANGEILCAGRGFGRLNNGL